MCGLFYYEDLSDLDPGIEVYSITYPDGSHTDSFALTLEDVYDAISERREYFTDDVSLEDLEEYVFDPSFHDEWGIVVEKTTVSHAKKAFKYV